MKKILFVLAIVLLCVGCDDPSVVKPVKDASIYDVEYNSIVLEMITDVKEKIDNNSIFISDNYLYLIPVGSTLSANCSSSYSGSPYGGNFIYAYVGVVKNGGAYTYYFVSKDSEGYGYNFNTRKQIDKYDGAFCYSGDILYSYDALGSYYDKGGDEYTEVDIASIDVNSSITSVLNFRDITKASIYSYIVCNN